MKQHSFCGAVLTLAAVVLFALPDITSAGSVHSGGFQSACRSTPVYVPVVLRGPDCPLSGAVRGERLRLRVSRRDRLQHGAINVSVPANAEIWFDGNENLANRKSAFVREPADPTGSGLRL